jgi:sec-independent protein translocase protein TatB
MFPENRLLEIMIIGAVALIVVGPKDLPILMRRVGKFVGKMRAMAAEFRASFDELARQSELDELRREVEAIRSQQMTALNNPLPPPSPAPEASPPAAEPAKSPETLGD